MTTPAQLRKAASAQPGAGEVTLGDVRGWAVAGQVFAALTAEGRAALTLGLEQRSRMAAELPGVTPTGSGVLVDLAAVNGMALNHWVGEAWTHVAPDDAVRAHERAVGATAGSDDDLPAVGAPARRALHGAGLGSLDAVAAAGAERVAALHGVGPRAVARLRQALADRGVTW